MNLEKANELVGGYLSYLKNIFEVFEVSDINVNWIDIGTPFLDSRRDYIDISIGKISDGAFVLTDTGTTLSNLELAGLYLSDDKFKRVVTEQLNCSGVLLGGPDKTELRKSFTAETFPQAFHEFIQCILALDALSVVNRLR